MPFKVDGTGILMAAGQWLGIPDAKLFAYIAADLTRYNNKKLEHVMVNQIPPGVTSGWHVDPEPPGGHRSRWHLPLTTNSECWFEEEGAPKVHMVVGYWWGPVSYWTNHRAWNSGKESRTHIILDLT
jgi:hypothetical protein